MAQALEAGLPPSVRLHTCAGNAALDAAASRARIVLGDPDRVLARLAELPDLVWVQSTWAGVTPLISAPQRHYRLSGVKGLFDRSISEYVLAWLLALQRGVLDRARDRQWRREPDPGLAGHTLGILGTGALGMAVARRAAPFDLTLLGLNTSGKVAAPFHAGYRGEDRLEFAARVDFVVSLMPHTAATDRLIDADFLDALPHGAVLINAGRANAVDHDALRERMTNGQLRAAVLDVLPTEPLPDADPLWTTPGVYITSHTAAPTETTDIVPLFLDNLSRYLDGQPLRYEVDFERGY
jgi:phosphoglycerate dehydrogenase-like enzyme